MIKQLREEQDKLFYDSEYFGKFKSEGNYSDNLFKPIKYNSYCRGRDLVILESFDYSKFSTSFFIKDGVAENIWNEFNKFNLYRNFDLKHYLSILPSVEDCKKIQYNRYNYLKKYFRAKASIVKRFQILIYFVKFLSENGYYKYFKFKNKKKVTHGSIIAVKSDIYFNSNSKSDLSDKLLKKATDNEDFYVFENLLGNILLKYNLPIPNIRKLMYFIECSDIIVKGRFSYYTDKRPVKNIYTSIVPTLNEEGIQKYLDYEKRINKIVLYMPTYTKNDPKAKQKKWKNKKIRRKGKVYCKNKIIHYDKDIENYLLLSNIDRYNHHTLAEHRQREIKHKKRIRK